MSEEWIEIFVTYDPIEAEIIKDLLESGGIRVVIRSGKVTPYPVNIGQIGEVRIFVRSQDKEASEELVKERDFLDSMNDNEQNHQ